MSDYLRPLPDLEPTDYELAFQSKVIDDLQLEPDNTSLRDAQDYQAMLEKIQRALHPNISDDIV